MTHLLRAEVRKLWTIWSTYVVFGIVVVIDLAFGFGLAYAPGGRRGGEAGIVPHGSSQWFVNIFSVLDNARLLALVLGQFVLLPFALIWVNHIGIDRLMGYGLKYPAGFGWTHLGRLGKRGTLTPPLQPGA